eukprot:COSAG02_NODE_6769_length_3370_cov_3.892999_2_plen_355_part_00
MEKLGSLLEAAADGDCGSGAVRAVREAAALAICEAAAAEANESDRVADILSGNRVHLHVSGELTALYDAGFDALNDPSLDEAVLADVLVELRRAAHSSGPPACALLSVPGIGDLTSALCRRCVVSHSLPFARFQNELCLLCVHHAIDDDLVLANDMLDAARVFARTADMPTREQLGSLLLVHMVATVQLLRPSHAEVERLVEMARSCTSMIGVDAWVQVYDHMCLELGTRNPRAIDEQEVHAVVMLLHGVAAASLKLRQGVFKRSMELLALSSRPNVREISLRLMVRVVGSHRALVPLAPPLASPNIWLTTADSGGCAREQSENNRKERIKQRCIRIPTGSVFHAPAGSRDRNR